MQHLIAEASPRNANSVLMCSCHWSGKGDASESCCEDLTTNIK